MPSPEVPVPMIVNERTRPTLPTVTAPETRRPSTPLPSRTTLPAVEVVVPERMMPRKEVDSPESVISPEALKEPAKARLSPWPPPELKAAVPGAAVATPPTKVAPCTTMPPDAAVTGLLKPIAVVAVARPERTMSPATVEETEPSRLRPKPTVMPLPVRETPPVADSAAAPEVLMPSPAVPVPTMLRLRISAPLPAVTGANNETPPSPLPIRLILPAVEVIVLSA